MVQTRAQEAAKIGRTIDENGLFPERQQPLTDVENQVAPASKRRRSAGNPSQDQRRKRTLEDTCTSGPKSPAKRQQISRQAGPETSGDAAAQNEPLGDTDTDDPIEFWRKNGRWPSRLFEPGVERLLARKRSSPTLSGRKRADSSSSTPSDQKPREEKDVQYQDPRYRTLLATKGSFMNESDKGIARESKAAYMTLLAAEQTLPTQSLFQDELFHRVCASVGDRNEQRVLRYITPLIVPSAEELAMRGSTGLNCLVESMNEGWNNSIPLTGIRPQPDYSVGFHRGAFTDAQLEKLSPFVGDFLGGDVSFFMATYYMYFPFLTCEVKCSAAALEVADRQNAHSSTLAARGIVELFRSVKREHEVHRQILSFSVSHDNCSVRIYGHYPVIDGTHATKYYRHPIHYFYFTALDGKERWTAYRFIKNVYDTWVPDHFKRICSAIDQLPTKLDLDAPALSESTGLSQGLESSLALPQDGFASQAVEGAVATPDTSDPKRAPKQAPAKKRKSTAKKSQD